MKLEHQIMVAERELSIRKSVYPKRVEARQMAQATADVEIAGMQAILDTLRWLQMNDSLVRVVIQENKELSELPATREIMDEFPGAKMTVRKLA